MRDICVYPSHNKYKFPKGLISIMNSFPAAYIIADDEERCGLFDLFSVCSNDIDETVEIPVDCSISQEQNIYVRLHGLVIYRMRKMGLHLCWG